MRSVSHRTREEVEQLRRSIALLQPGSAAMDREDAMRLLTPAEAVTFYGVGSDSDAVWQAAVEVGELLGPSQLGKVLGIRPDRSHQYLVARRPFPTRRAKVLDVLKLHAVRQLSTWDWTSRRRRWVS